VWLESILDIVDISKKVGFKTGFFFLFYENAVRVSTEAWFLNFF